MTMTDGKKRSTSPTPAAAPASGGDERAQIKLPDPLGFLKLARELKDWAESAWGFAGAATDMSMHAAKATAKPSQRAALAKAGENLRKLRETAGYSARELGEAINLEDPGLIELVEQGKTALPFEIVLRLAGVLGRNDPVGFIMKLTRSASPAVWRTLEDLGVGRLAVQAVREREFANIYRSVDAARKLSDEDFADVLAFTRAAFEMALAFRSARQKKTADRQDQPAD